MVQMIRQVIGLVRGFRRSAPMYGKPTSGAYTGMIARGGFGMSEARAMEGPSEMLGYVGLGMMGSPMARRLLNAGYRVTVWNRSKGKVVSLVEAGATLAADPSAVASTSSMIFMCLTDADAVEDVVFGLGGLAALPGTGKLVVDFSSIHPDAARSIAKRLQAANGMGWI